MVIATQNPVEQAGTYSLPEAQLDRFLIKTSLGYPDHDTAVDAAARLGEPRPRVEGLADHRRELDRPRWRSWPPRSSSTRPCWSTSTRSSRPRASTRTSRSASACAAPSPSPARSKTWAIAHGRTYVTPDDVRELAVPVLAHRIIVDPESEFAGVTAEDIVARVLVDVAPPAYRAA